MRPSEQRVKGSRLCPDEGTAPRRVCASVTRLGKSRTPGGGVGDAVCPSGFSEDGINSPSVSPRRTTTGTVVAGPEVPTGRGGRRWPCPAGDNKQANVPPVTVEGTPWFLWKCYSRWGDLGTSPWSSPSPLERQTLRRSQGWYLHDPFGSAYGGEIPTRGSLGSAGEQRRAYQRVWESLPVPQAL